MARNDTEGGQVRVLFVCLGNICRSPTAEGVFRVLAEREAPELRLSIDSAGTADYHVGSPPDARAQEAARRRGYDLSLLRARVVEAADFERFEYILAMDRQNLAALARRAPGHMRERVRLFLEFAPDADELDVPDPYYGGPNGFEQVLDLIESASRGLLKHLREQVGPG
jgi:protein-tyrosine phosphatase